MKNITIVLTLTFLMTGCATSKVPSERMLEQRSKGDSDSSLDVRFVPSDSKIVPKRTSAVVADIWVHPNEMSTGDYFIGGWIRSIVKEPHWTSDQTIDSTFKVITSQSPETKKKHGASVSVKNRN